MVSKLDLSERLQVHICVDLVYDWVGKRRNIMREVGYESKDSGL